MHWTINLNNDHVKCNLLILNFFKQITINFRNLEFLLDLFDICINMLKFKDENVINQWLINLSELMKHIPFDKIKNVFLEEI